MDGIARAALQANAHAITDPPTPPTSAPRVGLARHLLQRKGGVGGAGLHIKAEKGGTGVCPSKRLQLCRRCVAGLTPVCMPADHAQRRAATAAAAAQARAADVEALLQLSGAVGDCVHGAGRRRRGLSGLLALLCHRGQQAGTLVLISALLLLLVPRIQDLLQAGPLEERVRQAPCSRSRSLGVGAQAGVERSADRLAVEPHANEHQLLPAGAVADGSAGTGTQGALSSSAPGPASQRVYGAARPAASPRLTVHATPPNESPTHLRSPCGSWKSARIARRASSSCGQASSGSAAYQGPPTPSRTMPPAWLHSPHRSGRVASHTNPLDRHSCPHCAARRSWRRAASSADTAGPCWR